MTRAEILFQFIVISLWPPASFLRPGRHVAIFWPLTSTVPQTFLGCFHSMYSFFLGQFFFGQIFITV